MENRQSKFTHSKVMAKYTLIVLTLACAPYLVSTADDDVTLRYYTGLTPDKYSEYSIETAEEVVDNSAWNVSQRVIIYVHGLNENADSNSTITVVTAFLQRGGWNVLALNYPYQAKYSGIVTDAFAFLVTQSAVVGESMGQMMNRLVVAGVPVSSFYLIGYSVGAHVAGNAARAVNGTIPRITGLDPQLHGWYLFGIDTHLWDTDADTVDVVHSNGVIMSVSTALGTADFYPNKGYAPQPGCPIPYNAESVVCSSDVSWQWYAESVINPTAFKAISCDSWNQFVAGKCKGETNYMGYGYSPNATGVFYLQTNSDAPYSRGSEGIIYNGSLLSVLSAEAINFLGSIITWIFG